MTVISKCAMCKHHIRTDKSVPGHFKSFCKAFPDGEGIPAEVIARYRTVECGNGYIFEPDEASKAYFESLEKKDVYWKKPKKS